MTSVDSNVIIGLLNEDDSFNIPARNALSAAAKRGLLFVSPPVFVELSAMPLPDGWTLDTVLGKVGIAIDWQMEESIWRIAAKANREYIARRRKNFKLPRRIAADFLIGAHALARGAELLTFDQRTFRSAYPALKIVSV